MRTIDPPATPRRGLRKVSRARRNTAIVADVVGTLLGLGLLWLLLSL